MQPVPVDNIYKLKCIYVNTENGVPDINLVKQEIDGAIATGSTVLFMFHKVENTNDGLAISTQHFKEIVDYIDARKDRIDVPTISEWYYAYTGTSRPAAAKPAAAAAVTVTGVKAFADMPVAVGTTISAITLPAQVEATLSDGSTRMLDIVWNTDTYSDQAPGAYTLTGTLVPAEGVTNPGDIKASIRIVAEQPVLGITGIETVADITVVQGTTFSAITLPAKVKVTLSDGTERMLDVNWDPGAYNEQTPGTYTLTGTLILIEGITNTTDIKAAVRVIVEQQAAPDAKETVQETR